MKKNLNTFQLILLLVLGFSMVIGILLFAGVIPGFKQDASKKRVSLVMWGTVGADSLKPVLDTLDDKYSDDFVINYQQKDKETIQQDLVNALARSQGPDLLIFDDSMIVRFGDFISPLPYSSLPLRDFRNLFLDGSEIFLTDRGLLAVPLTIDPLVMYYNKDLYIQSQILQPPKNWSSFLVNHQKLNQVTPQGFIDQSGAALGSFTNIVNAKPILISLLLQTGVPIVSRQNDNYLVSLSGSQSVSAFEFFSRFATPGRAEYSWNVSLPEAKAYFSREELAHYFGFASELASIKTSNPNLNLDVSLVPSTSETKPSVTYGHFYGIAVIKASSKKDAAFQAVIAMTDREFVADFAKSTNLVPARRDLLVAEVTDPYQDVFYRAGVTAKAWFDPDPQQSNILFGAAVNSIISGITTTSSAVDSLQSQLRNILLK